MKSPLISIMVFAAGTVLLFFWAIPSQENLSLKKAQLAKKKAEFQTKEQFVAGLKNLREELQVYGKEFEKLNALLPEEESLPSLLQTVQNLAATSGLIVKTMNTSSSRISPESLNTVTVTLSLEGSYEDIKNFAEQILWAPRLLTINSLNFSSPNEKKVMAAKLTLQAYSY